MTLPGAEVQTPVDSDSNSDSDGDHHDHDHDHDHDHYPHRLPRTAGPPLPSGPPGHPTHTQPMSDTDDALRERLREALDRKAEADDGPAEGDDSTAQEMDGHDYDEEDEDDEDDEVESEADGVETEMSMAEIAEQVAGMAEADVTPEDVEDLLEPIIEEEGEDTRDHPGELKADEEAVRETVADEVERRLDERLPDGDLATTDDLESKLDEAVDALAAETKDVIQRADTARTPTPSAAGTDESVSADDLLSTTTTTDDSEEAE
jgi:hypothetical protein